MIDPNAHEMRALAAAGAQGGAYVEALAKTDLAQFTAPEWERLVEVIVSAYLEHLRAAYVNDPPF